MLEASPAVRTHFTTWSNVDGGFWWGQQRAHNTGVSAVAIAQNLFHWNITNRSPTLWHNPWADVPLTSALQWEAKYFGPSEGTLEAVPAQRAPHELFGLPVDWPGPEGPFETE